TLAPRMSAERLRPEAEGTLRRASASGVKRDERVKQKRNVVAPHVQIAIVNVGHVGQGVEVLGIGSIRIVGNFAVFVAVRDSQNFRQRFAVRKLGDGVIKLTAANKID